MRDIRWKYRIYVFWVFCVLFPFPLIAQQINWSNRGLLYIGKNSQVTSLGVFINTEEGIYFNEGTILFKSDLENHGVFKNRERGLSIFKAKNTQHIRGTRPSVFQDVIWNHQGNSGIYIHNEMEIYGEVNFFYGIVYTRNTIGKLTFHSQTKAIGASHQSFVDGYLKKYGSASFIFPIGDKENYSPLRIYGNREGTDSYKAIYHLENSNLYFPHSQIQEGILKINSQEYWELLEHQVSNPIYISLHLSTEHFLNTELYFHSEFTIVAWDASQQKWIDVGGVVEDSVWITTIFKASDYTAYTTAIKVEEIEDLEIFNAVNPKDTGGNHFFRIEGIERFPDNEVFIFNRFGERVYQTRNYASNNNVFSGVTDGEISIRKGEKLPRDTYFYVLKRTHPSSGKKRIDTGYLYLID